MQYIPTIQHEYQGNPQIYGIIILFNRGYRHIHLYRFRQMLQNKRFSGEPREGWIKLREEPHIMNLTEKLQDWGPCVSGYNTVDGESVHNWPIWDIDPSNNDSTHS